MAVIDKPEMHSHLLLLILQMGDSLGSHPITQCWTVTPDQGANPIKQRKIDKEIMVNNKKSKLRIYVDMRGFKLNMNLYMMVP